MHSRILISLAVVALALNTTYAEETDRPHLQFWKSLVGTGTFKESPGDVEGKVTWGLRTRGNTLMGWFDNNDGTVAREMAGWQADTKTLSVTGFGSGNNHWQINLPKVTATSVEGTASEAAPDGVGYQGKFSAKLEDENTLKYTMDGKTEKGEPLVRKGVFTRVVRDETDEKNWRTPWTWLLGNWEVKRSDGSSARVHWKKPHDDAEMLYGKWEESDGSVLNEVVGWHPDSELMVAHAYDTNRAYFWVSFNNVSPRNMTGWYGNRNAAGETSRGTVELEIVTDDMAKSTLTGADGTVTTETFTRVKE